jgi:hypothetical protein
VHGATTSGLLRTGELLRRLFLPTGAQAVRTHDRRGGQAVQRGERWGCQTSRPAFVPDRSGYVPVARRRRVGRAVEKTSVAAGPQGASAELRGRLSWGAVSRPCLLPADRPAPQSAFAGVACRPQRIVRRVRRLPRSDPKRDILEKAWPGWPGRQRASAMKHLHRVFELMAEGRSSHVANKRAVRVKSVL